MTVQVIGSGCPSCKKLFETASELVPDINPKIKVEYVTGDEGMQRLLDLGALGSPVISIGDKIVMTGFTPDKDKIKSVIQEALS